MMNNKKKLSLSASASILRYVTISRGGEAMRYVVLVCVLLTHALLAAACVNVLCMKNAHVVFNEIHVFK